MRFEEVAVKTFSMLLEPDLHRRLARLATVDQLTMGAFARNAIAAAVEIREEELAAEAEVSLSTRMRLEEVGDNPKPRRGRPKKAVEAS